MPRRTIGPGDDAADTGGVNLGLRVADHQPLAIAFASLVGLQYATSVDRVGWLVSQ